LIRRQPNGDRLPLKLFTAQPKEDTFLTRPFIRSQPLGKTKKDNAVLDSVAKTTFAKKTSNPIAETRKLAPEKRVKDGYSLHRFVSETRDGRCIFHCRPIDGTLKFVSVC